jgi:hypothetical protein
MKHRIQLSMRIAAVAAAALLTSACGDSGSPTEPPRGIGGAWTGTYSGVSYECEAFAQATFAENRGSVSGQINVSRPCGNIFTFRGTFQGNTVEGEFTDFDGFHSSGRGTVSDGALEIHLDDGWFGSSRMNFHR